MLKAADMISLHKLTIICICKNKTVLYREWFKLW